MYNLIIHLVFIISHPSEHCDFTIATIFAFEIKTNKFSLLYENLKTKENEENNNKKNWNISKWQLQANVTKKNIRELESAVKEKQRKMGVGGGGLHISLLTTTAWVAHLENYRNQ